MSDFDVIIRGGTVVDGSGADRFIADIAIKDGLIAKIGVGLPGAGAEEMDARGFVVAPGDMGENITTGGLDLLALPTGTRLHLGDTALIELTGLRQPCSLLDRFQPGLKTALLERTAEGGWRRKAGVMAVVLAGGEVYPGDAIRVVLPEGALRPLECV